MSRSGRVALLSCLAVFAFSLSLFPGDVAVCSELRIEPNVGAIGVTIRGRDARQQLFVTGTDTAGELQDFTHHVTYTSEPAGIVDVDATGLLVPLRDGAATVIATNPDGLTARLPIHVRDFANQRPINFKNQIVPIFTKLGCNSGDCHGKSSGQNGFKLSLLGFYPEDDFEFLVKEARGRRLSPSAPGTSLLIQKATGRVPHGGGKRMQADSYEYRMIARWIEQGMPYGNDDDPVVARIRCLPESRIMGRGADQQITVMAEYSDGTTEDVTRMALFEANDAEMAETTEMGIVKTLDLAGEVAIMARYQGQVSVFRSIIPLGAEVDKHLPHPANLIDEAVFARLRLLGIPPSPVCDDATFLRRVSIDIAGRLPTEEEARHFLENRDPAKRDNLIDQLLEGREYADYFTNKWNLVLRNRKQNDNDSAGMYIFNQWIWSSIYDNKPYDQFVREIITASGDMNFNPPVVWYREVDRKNEQVEDTAQLFLGLRIQCARCHHHPFERWSQNDYYGLQAFFSRVGRKTTPGQANSRDNRVVHDEGVAQEQNPRSGAALRPTGLGVSEPSDIPADRDPRVWLADWMTSPENPFFAPALVNRYWKHFFSRGIVEPEDDMRVTNPPANPDLLNGLSRRFIDSGFDVKELVRLICRSKTYQLSSLPNEYNLKDKQNFSRYYPKRLTAEVLYDAFHQVTNSTQGYSGMPAGSRAVQLPDPAAGTYFLKVFGQPQGNTACECERSQKANLAQSLHLLNSQEVQTKISGSDGRARLLTHDRERSADEKVRELFRWVYSRHPDDEELQIALDHVRKHEASPKVAWEDIVWALVNTKEFLFNH